MLESLVLELIWDQCLSDTCKFSCAVWWIELDLTFSSFSWSWAHLSDVSTVSVRTWLWYVLPCCIFGTIDSNTRQFHNLDVGSQFMQKARMDDTGRELSLVYGIKRRNCSVSVLTHKVFLCCLLYVGFLELLGYNLKENSKGSDWTKWIHLECDADRLDDSELVYQCQRRVKRDYRPCFLLATFAFSLLVEVRRRTVCMKYE